jgi:FMN phosphatase YigB (HAD superfamily)
MISKIVFDMDNTLVDEFGSTVRPGMIEFIQNLKNMKCHLYLWTNSKKERAQDILLEHKLNRYFDKYIFREDYDPNNSGKNKDIRELNAQLLIDDDPNEIKFVNRLGLKGFLIKPYRKNGLVDNYEYTAILEIIKENESFLKKIFK